MIEWIRQLRWSKKILDAMREMDNGWIPVYRDTPDSNRLVLAQIVAADRQKVCRVSFAKVRYENKEWIWSGKPTSSIWAWKELDGPMKVLDFCSPEV